MKKNPPPTLRRPFFARFLEGQELSRTRGGLSLEPGAVDYITLKYPSDDDENQTGGG